MSQDNNTLRTGLITINNKTVNGQKTLFTNTKESPIIHLFNRFGLNNRFDLSSTERNRTVYSVGFFVFTGVPCDNNHSEYRESLCTI